MWFCGTDTIRVVDTSSLSIIKEVPNVIPFFSDSEFGISLRGVSKNRGAEIVLSFVISNVWSLVYQTNGIDPDPKLGAQVLPSFKMMYVMEPSVTKQLIFCCGASKTSPTEACIAAITFDRSLTRVTEQVLTGEGLQAATAMKRFRDRDDLCLGCRRDMIVVRYIDGRGFDVLNRIPNVHSSKDPF